MSLSRDEPALIKEFRELYNYVVLMGRHINEIHNRLGKIEESINEVKMNHSSFVRENSAEIANIVENMVSKSEFNDLVERMEKSMAEMLPPLPTLTKEEPHSVEGQREAIGQ